MQNRKLIYTVLPFLFFFVSHIPTHAGTTLSKEEMTRLSGLEDSLVVLADSMSNALLPDDRIDYCVAFTHHLKTVLETPGSFNYPFKKLETKIHILTPEDKSFRIFNWMIAPAESLRRYFGAVQMNSEEPKFYPLKDYRDKMDKGVETATLTTDQWYGCEIYKIMPQTIQGQKAYLLFGFNSDGPGSNKKLIDVLTLDGPAPMLGAPVFLVPDPKGQNMVRQNRMILEYKKSAQVYLNYDAERKMIVFNRLASEVTDPNRKSTFIPTGQMDGLRFENGMFVYVRDAVPVLKLQDGQAPIDGVMKGG
jgi:hypothetical protein